jgi:hypothetical protein
MYPANLTALSHLAQLDGKLIGRFLCCVTPCCNMRCRRPWTEMKRLARDTGKTTLATGKAYSGSPRLGVEGSLPWRRAFSFGILRICYEIGGGSGGRN